MTSAYEQTSLPPLYTLPIELLEQILAELAYPDLGNIRNVSQAWRTLCNSPAIRQERKELLELRHIAASDPSTALIRSKVTPFLVDFDREAYLAMLGQDVPRAFVSWIRDTPVCDVVGWHWPGLRGEHSRDRYDELGIDFFEAMVTSRHLKPGYSLLPSANVMEVEDPDYAEVNNNEMRFYPGSWQCQKRRNREVTVRALQIWADMSGFSPKITLLILSGSERWNGHVWETEARTPFRHSPENITTSSSIRLRWLKPLGSWTDYLKTECKTLQERYESIASLQTYRAGLSGRTYVTSPGLVQS